MGTEYAFGLPPNAPPRRAINFALLQTVNSPAYEDVLGRYLSY